MKPTCTKCGSEVVWCYELKTERTEFAITDINEDWSHEGWEMGPARGAMAYNESEEDPDHGHRVFCEDCGHEMTWDDLYDQARDHYGEPA